MTDTQHPITMRTHSAIAQIPPQQWNALTDQAGHPLTHHAFLHALETTQCASTRSGWQPMHLSWWQGDTLVAALPLYLKTHSYGEYVFDWAWARAYTEAGGRYYPKLVSALPFTPCPGSRLLLRDGALRGQCVAETIAFAQKLQVSSLHILLSDKSEALAWQAGGALLRTGVQFHWENPGVATFDDYLATMSHDKRKRIKQERRKVREAGVTFRVLTGDEISADDWAHFYNCYATTYAQHQSSPYLSLDFFMHYAQKIPAAQLLIIGERNGLPICAALNWRGLDSLYGRYWGALEYVPGLHFDACYYQSLDWCIANRVQRFEGGAQGEHKLSRGFLPVETYSAHWLADPGLERAVDRFLQRERAGVTEAISALESASPFKEIQ